MVRRLFLPFVTASVFFGVAVSAAPIRVACLGDSITEGYGTGDPAHKSYPAQLAVLLGDGYDTRNFGVGGATLLDVGDKPYRSLPAFAQACAFQPDIIVIGLGTNDSKPQNWQHRDRFVASYVSLIRQLRALPTHPRIFICQPMPAWPPSGWAISPQVIERELQPMIADIARAEGVGLIDLFTPMRERHDFAPDHVHPDARGAAILARIVAAAIKAARRTQVGRNFFHTEDAEVTERSRQTPSAPPRSAILCSIGLAESAAH